MKLKNFSFLYLPAILLTITVCERSSAHAQKKSIKNIASPQIDTDVYVAGYIKTIDNQFTVAAFWKNGVLIKVSDSTKNCYDTHIAVKGGNVYVSGNYYSTKYGEGNGDKDITINSAVYWVNTQASEKILTPNNTISSYAYDIGVNNNGVYVVGEWGNKAVYWQNGNAMQQLQGDTTDPRAYGVYATGTDVYFAGENGGSAAYWKNGRLIKSGNSRISISSAHAITVDSLNVYMAGRTTWPNDTAAYWKNTEKPVYLTNGTSFADANAIAVNDGKVYIAGYETDTNNIKSAVYWENGVIKKFTDVKILNGIAVVGKDVYVTGITTTYKAAYWKNDIMKTLPRAIDVANIVVVTHPHQ